MTIVARHPSDEVLVMASDGLWDVMSNQVRPRCSTGTVDQGAAAVCVIQHQ